MESGTRARLTVGKGAPQRPIQTVECISTVDYENNSAIVKNIHGNDLLFWNTDSHLLCSEN